MSFNSLHLSNNPNSSSNSMHHQQYISSLTGSPSSSTGGSSTTAAQVQAAAVAAQAAVNMPLIASIANVKDSRWLTLEVCREYQRGKCTRSEQECKFAHPPSHVEVNSGKVIACFDSLKGKCNRTNPPCKYLHPPQHLRDILLQNGRNNLILRSIAMNLASGQTIYPQTATHLSYPNGAIIPNPLQQTASLASYPHLAPTGPTPSTLLFNQAGQAFTIPIHAASLQHLQQTTPTTAIYAPDGTPYFSPVTHLTSQGTGPKTTRTDRLEVCSDFQLGQCLYSSDMCPYAHPPAHCPMDTEGLVTVCVDFVKGKCTRETCKYFHPPIHLVAQLKAFKAQSAAAAHIYSSSASLQYSPSPIQFVHPLTLDNTSAILSAPPTTYTYSQTSCTAPPVASSSSSASSSTSASSSLQPANVQEDDGTYPNSFVSAYQTYPGHLQTIYTRAPSADLKDQTVMNSNNVSNGDGSSSSSSNSGSDVKAVIDPVSSSSSITQQTKKRPLEDDTATTGAYLQLPPGTQILAPPQYIQTAQQPQQPSAAILAHQQKRSAIADPKTGIPMAAYPVTAFSYPSPSPLPIQFQQPYLTAVPMTFTGYTSHMPRL